MIFIVLQYHTMLAGLLAISYLSIGLVLPLIMPKVISSLGMETREGFGALNSYVLENQRGLREIIQFGAGRRRLDSVREQTKTLGEKAKKLKTYESLTTAISGALVMIFSISMFLLSLYLFQKGEIGFEAVLIPTIIIISSFGPVLALSSLWQAT